MNVCARVGKGATSGCLHVISAIEAVWGKTGGGEAVGEEAGDGGEQRTDPWEISRKGRTNTS
jgi:hypothetical protein